jgi:ABC-type Fe3+ transport system permease subunit
MTTSSLFGIMAIVAFVLIWVFASVAFVFTRRMLGRTHVRSSLDIGTLPAVLHKVRNRESLTDDELGLAREVLLDRGSVMALAIPATLFCLGCFYVFGSLEQLHGHTASERTFLGVIPMITSTNMTIQMLRSARLKRRLPRPVPKRHEAAHPAGGHRHSDVKY